MRPWVTTVAGDADLPEAVDLVVIGGGIIGCSAALWAAEQGLRVALLEKGGIEGEKSGRNWGWCGAWAGRRRNIRWASRA